MIAESDFQLRKLLNETIDALDSLKRLGAPIDQWDYFLVPLTVSRLDNQTKKDWEDSDGDLIHHQSFLNSNYSWIKELGPCQ